METESSSVSLWIAIPGTIFTAMLVLAFIFLFLVPFWEGIRIYVSEIVSQPTKFFSSIWMGLASLLVGLLVLSREETWRTEADQKSLTMLGVIGLSLVFFLQGFSFLLYHIADGLQRPESNLKETMPFVADILKTLIEAYMNSPAKN